VTAARHAPNVEDAIEKEMARRIAGLGGLAKVDWTASRRAFAAPFH